MAVTLLAASACAQLPLRPSGVTVDSLGNLYYADTARNQVFESTAAGTLKLLAGTGEQGFSGDAGPATAALLNAPQALALTSDGTLYIADTGNNRIRAISPTGIITTVASGLHTPQALALDLSGNLLIADTAAHQILRLSGATLIPIAGTGTQGFAGDSGPATAALLDTPSGLAVLPDGRILIADTHNHRLRSVASGQSAGTITTLAGTGTRGFSGDSGPATAAQLALPRGLASLPDGTILLADSDNHRIRAISPTGIITTLTGTSTQGISTDATPTTTATLDTPRSIATNPYGAPVFTDHLVQALLSQTLYADATEATHTTTLTLTTTPTSATVTALGSAGPPNGTITLLDATTPIATTTLTNATATIPLTLTPGPHTLTATYSGDAFNPAASTTATLTTSALPTTTTFPQPPTTYAGLPLTLTANVSPTAATGTLTFTEGGNLIASAHMTNGTATAVYLAPTSGTHTLLASYSGDATYAPSTSALTTATINPMPDFTLTVVGPASQTSNNGETLTYILALTASPAPFSGAISLSASGLPATTIVTFAPPQVIPGATSATTTLSIPTDKLLASTPTLSPFFYALLLTPLLYKRRRKAAALFLLLAITGCGTRTANTPQANSLRTYTVTVTAVATNLAGALLSHSTQLTVTAQ